MRSTWTALLGVATLGLTWLGFGSSSPSAHEHVAAHHSCGGTHFQEIVLNGRRACASLAPGSDPSAIEVLEELIGHPTGSNPFAYSTTSRWSSTASGSGGTTGSPAILTYSFVPDGTLPSEGGTITNTLHASFDAKFGSTDTWKDIFREAFAEWGALTGITYIEETNDDSATWPETPGQLGVRGDIRIVSIAIDGASNVLGYNYFPNAGDMALDSAEAWGNSANDYRFFRNTLQHEMGHGIGLLHVWPLDGSKLMEPFLNENFAGPQDDDVRSGLSLYDDKAAGNDTQETAFGIGAFSDGLRVENLCLRNGGNEDWFWMSTSPGDRFTVTATPFGSSYQTGGSSDSTPLVNTLRQQPLTLTLRDSDGTLLRQTPGTLGEASTTAVVEMPSGSTGVYIQISSASSGGDVQRYDLEANASATALFNLTLGAVNGDGFNASFSPPDVDGTASAGLLSGETLVYEDGTRVTLTADEGTSSFEFNRWIIDGVQQPEGQRAVEVDITGNTIATAYYGEVFDAVITGNRSLVNGESTQLSVTPSGGQGPYTYQWVPSNLVSNPTSATTVATPSPGDSLTVFVRDSFGEEVQRAVIFSFVDPFSLELSEDQAVIFGQFPLLTATPNGGTPPYKYDWSPVAPNTDPTQASYAPQAGELDETYSVTVTDAAGRTVQGSVDISVIQVLTVSLPDDLFGTIGDTVEIEAEIVGGLPPYQISWFNGPRPVGSNEATLSVAPEATGMFLVDVSDASGQSSAALVRVEMAEPLQVVATGNRSQLKLGESVRLETLVSGGTPPLDFAWTPRDDLDDPYSMVTAAFPDRTTVYTVTVTDGRGRTTSDTIRIALDSGVTQPLEDPIDPTPVPDTTPDFVPVAPVATCGFGLTAFGPLTALALLAGRRRSQRR